MKAPRIYISYAMPDTAIAMQLAEDLKKAGLENVWLDQLNLMPSSEYFNENKNALENADVVLVVVSSENETDKILNELTVAFQSAKKVIPLVYNKVPLPLPLRTLSSVDLTGDYYSGLQALSYHLKNTRFQSTPAGSSASYPSPSKPAKKGADPTGNKKKNILKNVITALNPFKRKSRQVENEAYTTVMPGSSTQRNLDDMIVTGGAETIPYNPEKEEAFFPEMAGEEPPVAAPAAAAPQAPPPPAPQPPKGKILYDIPDNMTVNRQHKCIVRIGKDEAIVRDDDSFSGSEVVDDVPIARVMNVELIDINEPPHFDIKTISSTEQEVEEDSYTQWLFWVTPLTEGNFYLLLKVSVIKIIDGKERRKELVFERPVNIVSQTAGVSQTIPGSRPQNLLDEKSLAELDAPKVFVSYAHKDRNYFDVFVDNLAAQSNWNLWIDKNIEIGSDWYQRIQQAIKDSDMAVLLVSAFFISSGFIKENEYKKFIDLQKNKPGFIFLPVLLRDTDINRWQSLAELQFFSADGADYNIPEFNGKLLPFAALCTFNKNGELNENFQRDTYFKNFVMKANTDWLKAKLNLA